MLPCLDQLRDPLEFRGFPEENNQKLTIATFVDNIFAVAPTGNGAVSMLNHLER